MMVVTHALLLDKLRKGRIRRNCQMLSVKEKALLTVSLAYTKPKWRTVLIDGHKHERKVGRTIVEPRLVQKLEEFFAKLLETRGVRILKRGQAKAASLLHRLEQMSVTGWLAGLKDWLKDPAYLFWLGAVG